ncbi:mannonate dehydratase [Salinisphaera sp. USBA-960]|uniref:mannonate dehydratase n=1 Tax=Salinisphaera orenii TaxID=856731 RepID=UPI000DBE3DBD|nr:mannonate dehydratase [Salifodinibacter halophilus]NNC25939.1 mannonate dehydratase [Salifodinibacter halophilus]
MEYTWRWFGPNDPVSLAEIRQTGATGIVTALHEIDNASAWPEAAIHERKAAIEAEGLTWSVVESVPVTEAIRTAGPGCDADIEAYATTLLRLGAAGIKTVCYNFMPVADWTRTDLMRPLPNGGAALAFDYIACVAFDLFILQRPEAAGDYTAAERAAAATYIETLDDAARQRLIDNITAGLPGANAGYDLTGFRSAVAAYDHIGHAELRENLRYFLARVVPAAEQAGVHLAIHPDDPPQPLFGLPRIVSNADDARWILEAVDSPANGLTFCTGSYGAAAENDLAAMAAAFAHRIHFVHLRSVACDRAEPRSFYETEHLGGDVDVAGVMSQLLNAEEHRHSSLPMRADHGHHLLGDAGRPTRAGYPLYGRLKGLSELRGLAMGLRYSS